MKRLKYVSPHTEVIRINPEQMMAGVSTDVDNNDPSHNNPSDRPEGGGGYDDDAGAKVNPWGSWDE